MAPKIFLLLLWLGSLSLSSATSTRALEVLLSEGKREFFWDSVCLTWAYYEARQTDYDLYLPKEYNVTAASGDLQGVVRRADEVTKVACPSDANLVQALTEINEAHGFEIHFSVLPRYLTKSRKQPKGEYSHVHVSVKFNWTEEEELFMKTGGSVLVMTCEKDKFTKEVQALKKFNMHLLDLCDGTDRLDDPAAIVSLAMKAKLFFGAANTDTSAYIINQRRRQGLWAAEIGKMSNSTHELLMHLMEPAPWVFTYNDKSPTYDYMVTGLLMSAKKRLRPYCMFQGSFTSRIAQWLSDNGVMLMSHVPKWADDFWAKVEPHKEENLKHSHLYASKVMVVGTWQRIDIPIIHELQQFRLLLFSDSDVFFHKVPSYATLREHMPTYVSMAPEMQDMFPYNAGIMIINVKNLRLSYKSFLAFILSNQHGLYFPQFGPGDQGAYNEYYEKSIRAEMLPKVFNSKPYQAYNPNTWIVHFHGPKPLDYYNFFATGECRFGGMCRDGLVAGFCDYIRVWEPYCIDPVCTRITVMCNITHYMCDRQM